MDVEQLYQKLKLMKNKRDRPIYLVLGDCQIIHEVDDVVEARDCFTDDDGIREVIDAAGISKNSLILKI